MSFTKGYKGNYKIRVPVQEGLLQKKAKCKRKGGDKSTRPITGKYRQLQAITELRKYKGTKVYRQL